MKPAQDNTTGQPIPSNPAVDPALPVAHAFRVSPLYARPVDFLCLGLSRVAGCKSPKALLPLGS